MVESIALAKQTSIPNVVIISDACRSRADTLRTERVRGSLVFPNSSAKPAAIPDVDVLYATLVGDPSWEASVQDSTAAFSGIFTSTLLDAYRNPEPPMIATVDGKRVVPTGRLKPYLAREVPRRAQAASITITQRPDIQVVSDETTYIGRAGTTAAPPANSSTPPTVSEVARAAIAAADVGPVGPVPTDPLASWHPKIPGPQALTDLARSSGFSTAATQIVEVRGLSGSEVIRTGLQLSGLKLAAVRTEPGVKTKVSEGSGGSTLIEVDASLARAVPVVLRFADGAGSVFVALRDYIGSIVADSTGVSSVSYVPSRSNPFYASRDDARLAQLHALVASAARFGVFRIEGGRKNTVEASRLADRIRILKGYDATLGIYAAYAYAQADILEQVRSVRGFMRDVYGVELFDLGLLSGVLSNATTSVARAALPSFPMLSQGWALLRVKNVRLPELVAKAQDYLRPSLWSTFSERGVDLIERSLLAP